MFIAFKCFTRKGVGLGDRNSLGACTRGVFSDKAHKKRSFKAFKRVYLCLFTFLVDSSDSTFTKKCKKITFFLRISIFCSTFAPKIHADGWCLVL